MRIRLCLLITLACVVATAACAQEAAEQQPLTPGSEAPEFTASTLEGVPISLSQWEGRVVALNFFITWYRDAGAHLRMMEDLQVSYAEHGMRLLSISLDEGERAMNEVGELVRRHEIAHPVVRDPQQQLAGQYGVRALPAIFIIDQNGKIAHYHEGFTEGDELRLSQALASSLNVEPVQVAPVESATVETQEDADQPQEPVCTCFRPADQ